MTVCQFHGDRGGTAGIECIARRKLQQIHAADDDFGTDAQSWMNLQAHYDTELAKERIGAQFLAEIRQHATSV